MNQAKFGLLESWHFSWLSGWFLSMFASCIHSKTYPTYPLLILSLLAGNVKPCKTIGFQQKFWVPRPEVKTLTHSQAFFSLAFIASMQSFQQQSQILHLFATFLSKLPIYTFLVHTCIDINQSHHRRSTLSP